MQNAHGNLISGFGKAAAKGPASFHNNLVSNPGRGVVWINEVFNNLEIRNNHVMTRTTATPRKDELFGFNPGCDFKTIRIRDNLMGPRRIHGQRLGNSARHGAGRRGKNNVAMNTSRFSEAMFNR